MFADFLGVFALLVIVLRAAILCFQTIAVGGIVFLLVVARDQQAGREAWLHSSARLIRWSALAVALAQLSFVVSNTLVLTSSADLPIKEALGANYVIAGLLAIAAGLTVYF